MKIEIYTDGACSGNPGPGGYGAVLLFKNHRKEISGGFRKTTNNRMELLAVILALEAIKVSGVPIVLYSDSSYVVNAVEKGWLFDWENKAFKKIKNPDLWKRFLVVLRKHSISFVWVKGHDGNIENERCDKLAVLAYQKKRLDVDDWYEKNTSHNN
jgi:ribonuclease HI